MSYDLIDDAIWERLAPLLRAQRRRSGHRHGRTKKAIHDRAIWRASDSWHVSVRKLLEPE